jgi:yeast amino acid transporter
MGEDFDTKIAAQSDSQDATSLRKGSVAVERRLSAGEWDTYRSTLRGLAPRHVQLMAIGGSIGTGLFVGIGGPLSRAGPLSVFLGYLAWGLLFIWPCCLCVGEMMAYLPVRGSIFELASRYVHPALGFGLGWTYFFAGAMLVCVEYSAVATVMQYWVPATQVNPVSKSMGGRVICDI